MHDAAARKTSVGLFQLLATILALLIMPYTAIRTKFYDLDPDIWWHIRVGDWIANHRAIPHVAIFSQYSDRPWVPYSWCFELLVSGVHALLGLPGIPKLLVCIQILVSLAFLLGLRRIAGSFWRSWPIAVLAILASEVNPLRPMTVTVLFFILELLLIFETERSGNDQILYWLGPLFVMWANCHIQFVYGIAVIGLYVASRMLRLVTEKVETGAPFSFNAHCKLAGIFGVAFLGSCIGPNGWSLYNVAIGLATQTFVFQIIQEMQAMNFRSPLHFIELLLVMAACFAIGRSKSRDLFRPALLAMAAMVSFRSLRDMWFAAAAAAFVIAEAVRVRPQEIIDSKPRKNSSRMEVSEYALATALAIVIALGYGARHGMNTPDMIQEIGKVYPVEATEFVRDSHLKGPMYNSMNWGGFLIFNLRQLPVSIDPRTNIYGDQLLARSVGTTDGIKWQSDPVLARSNLVVLERYVPLANELLRDSDYRLVYQDPIALVFVRQDAQKPGN
jgi:hypothetical protein